MRTLLRGAAAVSMALGWLLPAAPTPVAVASTAPAVQPQARAESAAAAPILRSNMGTEFRLVLPAISRCTSANGSQQFGIYVSSDAPGTGRLSAADDSFSAIEFAVQPGEATTITVPNVAGGLHPFAAPDGTSSKSALLTATTDVSVFVLDFCKFLADAYAAIPDRSAGMEYMVAGYTPSTNSSSRLIVIAQEASTTVTVTWQTTTTKLPLPAYPVYLSTLISTSVVNASPPISTVVLNAGQVFVNSKLNTDMSGSLIQSDKPVVVLSHVPGAIVPDPYFANDQLLEAMPPLPTWGRRYVAMATPYRKKGDTIRIYGAEDGTQVFSNGALLGTLDRMQWMEYRTLSRDTKLITSTKAVMVQRYMNGTDYDGATGDPSMLTLQPLEQGMTRYVFATPKDMPQNGSDAEYTNTVNIAAPDATGLRVYVDGIQAPLSVGGGNGFVTATVYITPGSHVMTGTLPFVASVEGQRNAESYAYPGGSGYVDLSKVASVSLYPDAGDYSVQKGDRCFVATVKDVDGVGVPGLPVYFYGPAGTIVAGANADENGRATICYTGQDGDVGLQVTAAWQSAQADIRWHNTLLGNANLYDLQLSPGELSPTFISNTTQYTASVPLTVTSVTVTPTLYMAGAYTITSSPGTCAPANSPASCSLQTGLNTLIVTAASEDGTLQKPYVIQVMRGSTQQASNDANLGGLAIHPGTLDPAFVSDTMRYTARVPAGTAREAVTATVNDVSATVAYASTAGACTPGNASPSECVIASTGTTTITVTVTAADGTKKPYEIVITVADPNASGDANLLDLSIEPGTLTPGFVSSTKSYKAVVANDVDVVTVTAQLSDPAAAVTFAPCTPVGASRESEWRVRVGSVSATCAVVVGVNHITATVTAENGDTKQYVIVVTRAAPLTTISLVWPNLGVPAGGMPVSLFGSGLLMATGVRVSNTITNVLVPFTITSDGRIDFVMPAGVDGTTADITVETATDAKTVEDGFRYMAPAMVEFDGEAGAVLTTPNGVVITVPPQGVGGMFVITITPQTPEPGVPGSVLMHVFRLDALLNWVPLSQLTNAITIALPVDPAIVPAGETPYLWEWVGAGVKSQSRESERGSGRAALHSDSDSDSRLSAGGHRSAVVRSWSLVKGQSYDPATKQVTVALRPMGLYALSTSIPSATWDYWFPLVPRQR